MVSVNTFTTFLKKVCSKLIMFVSQFFLIIIIIIFIFFFLEKENCFNIYF